MVRRGQGETLFRFITEAYCDGIKDGNIVKRGLRRSSFPSGDLPLSRGLMILRKHGSRKVSVTVVLSRGTMSLRGIILVLSATNHLPF